MGFLVFNNPVLLPFLSHLTFAAETFQSPEFLLLSFYTKVCGSQKPSTAPMAQGMNHIVYVTLR